MNIQYSAFSENIKEAVLLMLNADNVSGHLFRRILSDAPECCRMILTEGEPAGFVFSERSGAGLYVMPFIAREMRGRGIGSAVLRQAEADAGQDITKLTGFFNKADAAAAVFAEKHGFTRHFDSDYMEYTGGMMEIGPLPVRPYRDEDYLEAHKMYAEAFHRMRVQVGDFPDSIPYPPTEKNRAAWLADAENYFMYVEDGAIVGVGHLNGGEIGSVSVRIDRQGNGIGRKFALYLMNEILRRGHEKVALECVVGNFARRLYDSLGFRALYTERFVDKKIR